MKKLMLVPLVAFGLVLAVNVSVSIAQENNAAVAVEENNNEDKFSFGKVISVNAQEVMVKEYDFAKDADVEVTYTITAETEFGNVNMVTDLAVNDDVVLDYIEKDGKRIVTTLVKEDKGAEAPMVPVEGEAVPAADVAAAEAPAADAAEAAPLADAAVPVEQQ
jgi:hypothetical protein